MSRIIIEVETSVHRQIKTMASVAGKSIKEYVLEKVFPAKEKKPNRDTIKAMQNILAGKNLVGPFKDVDSLFKHLESQ